MTERKQPKIKFVGLHAHSTFSVFDGFGYPGEHIDFAYENGMDSLALTDHGHMNGFAHQVSHAKKMNKEGKVFKPIFGVEAYFIPSISEWLRVKSEYDEDKEAMDDDSVDGYKNAIKHYRHMVLLAQNPVGLKNIFKMVSLSHRPPNFYRRPRIDYDMLRQYSEGVVATSACMGGIYGGDYWQHRHDGDEAVYAAAKKTTEEMLSIFGDRWYGELQWNNLPDQIDYPLASRIRL